MAQLLVLLIHRLSSFTPVGLPSAAVELWAECEYRLGLKPILRGAAPRCRPKVVVPPGIQLLPLPL